MSSNYDNYDGFLKAQNLIDECNKIINQPSKDNYIFNKQTDRFIKKSELTQSQTTYTGMHLRDRFNSFLKGLGGFQQQMNNALVQLQQYEGELLSKYQNATPEEQAIFRLEWLNLQQQVEGLKGRIATLDNNNLNALATRITSSVQEQVHTFTKAQILESQETLQSPADEQDSSSRAAIYSLLIHNKLEQFNKEERFLSLDLHIDELKENAAQNLDELPPEEAIKFLENIEQQRQQINQAALAEVGGDKRMRDIVAKCRKLEKPIKERLQDFALLAAGSNIKRVNDPSHFEGGVYSPQAPSKWAEEMLQGHFDSAQLINVNGVEIPALFKSDIHRIDRLTSQGTALILKDPQPGENEILIKEEHIPNYVKDLQEKLAVSSGQMQSLELLINQNILENAVTNIKGFIGGDDLSFQTDKFYIDVGSQEGRVGIIGTAVYEVADPNEIVEAPGEAGTMMPKVIGYIAAKREFLAERDSIPEYGSPQSESLGGIGKVRDVYSSLCQSREEALEQVKR